MKHELNGLERTKLLCTLLYGLERRCFGANHGKFVKYTFVGMLVSCYLVGSLSASAGMCGNSHPSALIFANSLVLGHE